jgi:hypothetical protein
MYLNDPRTAPIVAGCGMVVGLGRVTVPGRPPFGQHVNVDASLTVSQLGPPTSVGQEDFKAAHRRRLKDVVNAIARQHDIDILRDAAHVAMSPHGPAADDDGLAAARREHLIERLDHSPIPARQVLRFKHARPPN